MTNSNQKILLNSDDYNSIIEELRLLRAEVEGFKEVLMKDKVRNRLFGEWISEREVIELTGYSRSSLYSLYKQGLICKSTISGKGNYYKTSDFNRLLNKNQY